MMILDLGGEFIDMEEKNRYGDTLLMDYTIDRGFDTNHHCVKILLDRGASVKATDTNGGTCLHRVFCNPPGTGSKKESLMLLIQANADIHATDNYGVSVSDVAYNGDDIKNKIWNIPSTYRRDIWEEALTECGKLKEAALFRKYCDERDFQKGKRRFRVAEEFSGDIGAGFGGGYSGDEGSKFDKEDSEVNELVMNSDNQDLDAVEPNLDVVMQNTNFTVSTSRDNSSNSTNDEGLILPRIEELMDANIWAQPDQMSEAHVQSPSTTGQPALPWIGDMLDDHEIWSTNNGRCS